MKTNERIYRPEGAEGTCPNCGNGNAMLNNSKKSGYYEQTDSYMNFYKCRDCGYETVDPVFYSEEPGIDWEELDRITDCGRNVELPKRENTDELLKEAQAADFQRTSDLFDLWRGGMIDRAGLNNGCKEIIANAKFQALRRQEPLYTIKPTTELLPGDIVTFHGAKVQVTFYGRCYVWQGDTRPTMAIKGRILEYGAIPKSWAHDGFWNIQGNELALWTIIN